MLPLSFQKLKSHKGKKVCYKFVHFIQKDRTYRKLKITHCFFKGKYRGAAHCICYLRCLLPTEIPIVMHDGSKYDFHLIIRILPNKFDSRYFNCLGEKTETSISFSAFLNKRIGKCNKT